MMKFSILALLFLSALSVSANPYNKHYELNARDLENQIVAREAYIETFDNFRRNILDRRLALARGGGGGGGGRGGPKAPPKDKNNKDNKDGGGGIQPVPPGFSAEGKKGTCFHPAKEYIVDTC